LIGERRFLKKELDMGERGTEGKKNSAQLLNLILAASQRMGGFQGAGSQTLQHGAGCEGLKIRPTNSLDLLMHRGGVAVAAELFQFEPFGGVAAVFLGGVTRHARGPLGGVGPAFRALKSDHDPDALVFGHGRTLRRESEAR
jgi:hypothetical protein